MAERLSMVQRSVQGWAQIQTLKEAYRVLFSVRLDEEDPKDGKEIKKFLEDVLPARLAEVTGSRDASVWIEYLMKNGEMGLDGRPLGRNFYADQIREFDRFIKYWEDSVKEHEQQGPQHQGLLLAELRMAKERRDSYLKPVEWLRTSAQVAQIAGEKTRSEHFWALMQFMLLLSLLYAGGKGMGYAWSKMDKQGKLRIIA